MTRARLTLEASNDAAADDDGVDDDDDDSDEASSASTNTSANEPSGMNGSMKLTTDAVVNHRSAVDTHKRIEPDAPTHLVVDGCGERRHEMAIAKRGQQREFGAHVGERGGGRRAAIELLDDNIDAALIARNAQRRA